MPGRRYMFDKYWSMPFPYVLTATEGWFPECRISNAELRNSIFCGSKAVRLLIVYGSVAIKPL
jgi:hypothetical protein